MLKDKREQDNNEIHNEELTLATGGQDIIIFSPNENAKDYGVHLYENKVETLEFLRNIH